MSTDQDGIAVFEDVPATVLHATLEQDETEGAAIYSAQPESLYVEFKPKIGFEMSGTTHGGFVIQTMLVVEGIVQQKPSSSRTV